MNIQIDKKTIGPIIKWITIGCAVVIFLFTTFAQQRDLLQLRDDLKNDLQQTRIELKDTNLELKLTRERLLIVNTIVMNKQETLSKKYE